MPPGDVQLAMGRMSISAQLPSDQLQENNRRRHYLKKLLLTRLIEEELSHLNDPRAIEHFGDPFKRERDALPIDAEHTNLPILHFVFHRFVCTFPFLAKTDQRVFWGEKVQVFLQAFAEKRISSSEDRAESSKRAKLAERIKSMLVLLLNAGVRAHREEHSTTAEESVQPTCTNTEKRRSQNMQDLERTGSHGMSINVAGVRTMQKNHRMMRRRREHHSEFLVRTKRAGKEDVIVARRYGAFKNLHAHLKEEFPGKQIPRLPAKNKAPATASSYIPSMPTFGFGGGARPSIDEDSGESADEDPSIQTTAPRATTSSLEVVHIPREKQRLTLRAFLQRLLKDQQIAQSTSLRHFLLDGPIQLSEEETQDIKNRADLDALREEERIKFLEVAKEKARELDMQMHVFKRDLIQENGLGKIFAAIRECERVEDLPPQYIKVIEWARIEIAATLYQLFVADDNASELFAQAKRVHSLFPYSVLKNIMRFSNPMMMMRGGIDLFLATPFGRASLFQRMFSSTLTEELREIGVSIESLRTKIADDDICNKIRAFVHAREDQQAVIRLLAQEDEVDLLVSLLRNNELDIGPDLQGAQITKVFLANVAWTKAVDGDASNEKYNLEDARMYGYFSQLLKLYTRQRDKEQMMDLLFDGATSNLLKDIVGIFYEPLARVYKAANIHNSINDLSQFVDDMIVTVKDAEEQDLNTSPNALVQTFIDLTARHQNSFFHFVHEAHAHDDGLFDGLLSWVQVILSFLRDGTAKELDLDAIFDACEGLDHGLAVREIDSCSQWNTAMKAWRQKRLEQRVGDVSSVPTAALSGTDFGLDQNDLDEMWDDDESDGEEEMEESMDDLDPLEAEMKRKKRALRRSQRRFGEPEMPVLKEVYKMAPLFKAQLRTILANS